MKNPAKFIREVRQEAGRVTWPTRKETATSTTFVLVLVAVASIFFMIVDYGIQKAMGIILGIGE